MNKEKSRRNGTRVPVYVQIEEALRNAIVRGTYQPGAQLPSETELAKRFATTRSTVIHALQKLVYDRIIERRQGRGTFVADNRGRASFDTSKFSFFERYIVNSGLELTYSLVDFVEVPRIARVNAMLSLSERESLYRVRRVRWVQGKPLALEIRFMPSLTAARINETLLTRMPLQDIFMEELGIRIVSCPTIVRVNLAGPREVKYLNVAKGRPIFVNEHTFRGLNDKIELWGETVYTENFQLRYDRLVHPNAPDSGLEIRLDDKEEGAHSGENAE